MPRPGDAMPAPRIAIPRAGDAMPAWRAIRVRGPDGHSLDSRSLAPVLSRRMWGKTLAVAALASCLACGGNTSGVGGGGAGTCATAATCGGDIVGTWVATSACVHTTGTIAETGGCAIDVDEVDSNIS